MSLFTRHFFDKIQNSSFTKLRLPAPPYHEPSFWDRAYKDLSPDDCIEWGGFDVNHLLKFRYERVPLDDSGDSHVNDDDLMTMTLAECLDLQQHSSPEEASAAYQTRQARATNNNTSDYSNNNNDAILLLGCGNSKMGEQLLINSFEGPFLHVDVSSKVITSMTQRYERYIKEAKVQRMEFIVDDATEGLTSLEPNSVGGAVIDKGVFDALHCSLPNINIECEEDEMNPIQSIMESVHRVLQPSRPFVFFSRSNPEFMMRRVFGDGFDADERRKRWDDISVVKLTDLNVMLYRLVKADESLQQSSGGKDSNTLSSVTTRAFKRKHRQRNK
eukprot:scaffold35457_cov62-Cyclotella_meneghiniana.AAC.3